MAKHCGLEFAAKLRHFFGASRASLIRYNARLSRDKSTSRFISNPLQAVRTLKARLTKSISESA